MNKNIFEYETARRGFSAVDESLVKLKNIYCDVRVNIILISNF